jgi:hypothetical protein
MGPQVGLIAAFAASIRSSPVARVVGTASVMESANDAPVSKSIRSWLPPVHEPTCRLAVVPLLRVSKTLCKRTLEKMPGGGAVPIKISEK